MSKRKSTKKSKSQRRKKELLRAQVRSGFRSNTVVAKSMSKKATHQLHIKYIKTDLVKTAVFIIFAVVLLLILKNQGLQLNL